MDIVKKDNLIRNMKLIAGTILGIIGGIVLALLLIAAIIEIIHWGD